MSKYLDGEIVFREWPISDDEEFEFRKNETAMLAEIRGFGYASLLERRDDGFYTKTVFDDGDGIGQIETLIPLDATPPEASELMTAQSLTAIRAVRAGAFSRISNQLGEKLFRHDIGNPKPR